MVRCERQNDQGVSAYSPRNTFGLVKNKPVEITPPVPDPLHIRSLLGDAAWQRLKPAIRKRFGCDAQPGKAHLYRGKMKRVEASLVGLLMAHTARLIGSPMAWSRGVDVPCDVITFDDPDRKRGIVWERHYYFAPDKQQIARTTKLVSETEGLLECFGKHFGMKLKLEEADGALHFISTKFYLQLFGKRLSLPDFLSPGTLHVTHRDLGDNWFQFVLEVDHPVLGQLAFQDGYFKEEEMKNATRA
ncbi:hypothetical protein WH95_08850 [Kiloniella litopenaei]|uniref:DUF4166 domain-containing protein n=1 Tax=Kiloniella litopenaei TaxID=1549748 RepID=A0A0M2R9R8_9PROT|nr:DUF4166 domain-containing protein [Kiloniella litopenaei]KKJ77164.1 hypothetical protein WH95_08850 [Kiloniella litopenaei]